VSHPPRIFSVNWFRRDGDGRFVWPGFGQNMRILKWIFERCAGVGHAEENPLGLVPGYGDLDWEGLSFDDRRFHALMDVDLDQWSRELESHDRLFSRLGDKQPPALAAERGRLARRIGSGPAG
jgi:phosphoenolpyruvate carboxykinase (GTP)